MPNYTVKGLLGQPVITLDAGRRVGSIQEILFDTLEHRVTAVILSKPPVAGSAKAVTAEHIRLFGADVTLIDSDRSITTLGVEDGAHGTIRAGTDVIRTQVITTEGRRLGEVSDITLDAEGTILGYRLSHNLLRDTFRGKPFIPVGALFAVGHDALLVDVAGATAEVEDMTEESSGESDAPAYAYDEPGLALEGAEDEATFGTDEDELDDGDDEELPFQPQG
ncbi:MAG: hypothetical protein GXX93_05100 [Anaerolineae bacterium]|nr:hypothetical protein [Anaerolineae bacterium]